MFGRGPLRRAPTTREVMVVEKAVDPKGEGKKKEPLNMSWL
jgi:hypothetical protein